jgi:hypothetical protein
MSDPINTPPTEPVTPPVTPPNADTTDWKAEAEKWKGFSRKHEDSWKQATKELDAIKTAGMTDVEKAVAEANAKTLSGVAEMLATADLKVAAAKAGVDLPDTRFINMKNFVNDGKTDSEAIEAFIKTLGTGKSDFADPAKLGMGATGGGAGKPEQYTREKLRNMTHAQIVEAQKKGHLNDLLGITT